MSKSLIIIPTYNERDNIKNLLTEIYKNLPETHILIVDDNSPDKTYDLVEELIDSTYGDKLHLYKRAGKLGLGTAYLEGFAWALKRDYSYIFEMDADFSHNPIYLPDFIEAIKDKCFRRETLETIPLDRIRSNGYSFQVELNYITFIKGLRIKEIPIIFEDRIIGNSKMSKKIFLEAIKMVWKMRFNRKSYL